LLELLNADAPSGTKAGELRVVGGAVEEEDEGDVEDEDAERVACDGGVVLRLKNELIDG
jgi:hypothetical protein